MGVGHDLVGAGGPGSRTEPEPQKQGQVKRNLKTWGQQSLRWANRVGVGACRKEEKEGAGALRRAGVGVGRMGADGGGGARG